MIKYSKIISRTRAVLKKAGLLKLAEDLVKLLDHPMLAYPTGEKLDNWAIRRVVEMREKVFNALCKTLVTASPKISLPPLEPQFYECLLVNERSEKDRIEADRIRTHVAGQLKVIGNPDAAISLEAILGTISILPQCLAEWGGADRKTCIAKMNQLLLAEGKEPIRPNFSEMELIGAHTCETPPRKIRIIIFDDDVQEILKSYIALAGWLDVEIVILPYQRVSVKDEAEKSEAMNKAAMEIIALLPDIVLMDQGLIDFDGSALIPVIKGISSNPPLFVANTGGDDTELRRAGAFPNFNKGSNIRNVVSAVRHLQNHS